VEFECGSYVRESFFIRVAFADHHAFHAQRVGDEPVCVFLDNNLDVADRYSLTAHYSTGGFALGRKSTRIC
jgi:hypothetical protein